MKKLLLFSAIVLGSVGLATAQTGKKVKDTKKVEQAPKVELNAATQRPKPAKTTPAAAQSLFQATKPAAEKKN